MYGLFSCNTNYYGTADACNFAWYISNRDRGFIWITTQMLTSYFNCCSSFSTPRLGNNIKYLYGTISIKLRLGIKYRLHNTLLFYALYMNNYVHPYPHGSEIGISLIRNPSLVIC